MRKIGKKHRIANRLALVVLLFTGVFILGQGALSASFAGEYIYYAGQRFEAATPLARAFSPWLRGEVAKEEQGQGQSQSQSLAELVFEEPGSYQMDLSLWGLVDLKSVALEVAPALELVPGGESLGIIMKTEGVIVVGFSAIPGEEGMMLYPSKEAGFNLGDTILKINGVVVTGDRQAAELIDRFGALGDLEIEVRQGEDRLTKTVEALKCPETGTYRIGLYIRDDTGGVGTLTFYEEETLRYGALGHKIGSVASSAGEVVGSIMPANIQGLIPGEPGVTGEKIGYFEPGAFAGTIDVMGEFGIFGVLEAPIQGLAEEGLAPARPDQVQEGPAEIYTVLAGATVESFEVNILKIDGKAESKTKGLLLEVTDPELLAETGGIIQGMSGSPIIQNGLLIGAVTHVLIKDPSKGYGCLIDCMLREGGMI